MHARQQSKFNRMMGNLQLKGDELVDHRTCDPHSLCKLGGAVDNRFWNQFFENGMSQAEIHNLLNGVYAHRDPPSPAEDPDITTTTPQAAPVITGTPQQSQPARPSQQLQPARAPQQPLPVLTPQQPQPLRTPQRLQPAQTTRDKVHVKAEPNTAPRAGASSTTQIDIPSTDPQTTSTPNKKVEEAKLQIKKRELEALEAEAEVKKARLKLMEANVSVAKARLEMDKASLRALCEDLSWIPVGRIESKGVLASCMALLKISVKFCRV